MHPPITQPAASRSSSRILPLLLAGLALLGLSRGTAAAEPTSGWRGDGTGHFPGAKVGKSWDPKKSLLWRAPVDGPSNASPVVVNGRVLVTVEPNRLRCLHLDDGRLLWERAFPAVDTLPAADAARVRTELARADTLRSELGALEAEYGRLRRAARGKGPAAEKAVAELEALKTRRTALEAELKPLGAHAEPSLVDARLGTATPTPSSDGRAVYVSFGNGVVAAVDLGGKVLWRTLLPRPQGTMNGFFEPGVAASPRVHGGRLVVAQGSLHVLDTKTGRVLWHADTPYRDFGTPALVPTGADAWVLTSSGDVFRLSDGRRLASGLTLQWYASPVVRGRSAFFAGVAPPLSPEEQKKLDGTIPNGGLVRLDLPEGAPAEKAAITRVFSVELAREGHFSSPLVHGGLVFVVSEKGVVRAVDAATGAPKGERRLDVGAGRVYASLVRVDDALVVLSEHGRAWALSPTAALSASGPWELGPTKASPVFSKGRMLLRTEDGVQCHRTR